MGTVHCESESDSGHDLRLMNSSPGHLLLRTQIQRSWHRLDSIPLFINLIKTLTNRESESPEGNMDEI